MKIKSNMPATLRVATVQTNRTAIWNERERTAWRPPENINAPQWAEKNRKLTRRQSSRPGPWRNANAPHAVGIMLMATAAWVEQLNILKGSQTSASEAIRCVLGYWADHRPDPVLLVLPDKETGKGIIHHRIIPLIEDTPRLRTLMTGRRWDTKNNEITLANGFTLRLGFSGSITSVATHPARAVICDERSKFQDDGKVSIADSIESRTTTYDWPIVINLSSPGAEPDPTTQLFDASSIKLYYFVACPHCGRHQRLVWGRYEWEPKRDAEPDKNIRADRVVAADSAWIRCENDHCAIDHPATRGRIYEADRQTALRGQCFWATEDQSWRLHNDGHEEGTRPRGSRVGMHVPGFITLEPKHRIPKVVERFVRAEGDITALRGWYNEVAGEVFRDSVAKMATPTTFQIKCRADQVTGVAPPLARKLQPWVSRLIMTVDTQKDYFWFVVRGWGYGFRSHRVHHGRATTFQQLADLFYRGFFPYVDDPKTGSPPWQPLRCFRLGIDSGGGVRRTDEYGIDSSRTDEVYRWCLTDPTQLIALKGEGRRPLEMPFRLRRVTYQDPLRRRDPYEVFLHLIDAGYYEDLLASAIDQQLPVISGTTGELTDETVDQWQLNDQDDDEYNAHLASVVKVMDRRTGKRAVMRWMSKTIGARHDYRDLEVYQQFMAHGPGQCGMLPSEQQRILTHERERQLAGKAVAGGITTPDGRSFIATQR